MRDPARIDKICDIIRDVWKKSPDMRLGQLIVCVGSLQERGVA